MLAGGSKFSVAGGRHGAVEAETHPTYICQMPEMFKCPHCGAVYEVNYEKTVPPDEDAADCQVCGKQMRSRTARSLRATNS
jgi:predicted Zn finger-like uncharacterized protein